MNLEKNEPIYGADIIPGRNPVAEALRAGRPMDCLYIAKGQRTGQVPVLAAKARELGIPVKEADPRKLSHMCNGANHQGVVAVAAAKEYATVEDMLALAAERGEPPLLILCDGLEDPHNLGAVLRAAECSGAHGVVIPKADLCGEQSLGRGGGVCAGGPGAESGGPDGGPEGPGAVDCGR